MRHPLSEVCPALTASTTMRMAWMTTGALSIMMFIGNKRARKPLIAPNRLMT